MLLTAHQVGAKFFHMLLHRKHQQHGTNGKRNIYGLHMVGVSRIWHYSEFLRLHLLRKCQHHATHNL
jgi:hypothetical protein